MEIISLTIYLAEPALAGIILWYVIEWLPPMPARVKRACQLLIVLIFVLAAIRAVVSDAQTSFGSGMTRPLGPGTPNLGR